MAERGRGLGGAVVPTSVSVSSDRDGQGARGRRGDSMASTSMDLGQFEPTVLGALRRY